MSQAVSVTRQPSHHARAIHASFGDLSFQLSVDTAVACLLNVGLATNCGNKQSLLDATEQSCYPGQFTKRLLPGCRIPQSSDGVIGRAGIFLFLFFFSA